MADVTSHPPQPPAVTQNTTTEDTKVTTPGEDDKKDSSLYAGHTRFELELEFVTALSSPLYLNHLASQKLFAQPAFVAYLSYLRYWSRPEYVKFLAYPGPTLKALELLQEERFRTEILSPDVVGRLMREGVEAAGMGGGENTG